jgi:DNA repair photolyase
MTRVWTGGASPCEIGYTSPRISGEVYECGLPLTFDQYSRCSYQCLYCFAVNQKSVNAGAGKSQYEKPVRCVDPDAVRRMWSAPDRVRNPNGSPAMLRNLIQRHVPVHWGGLADPFDDHEELYRVGLELMRFWRSLDWPVVFSTKGALMVQEPWRSVLAGGKFRFQQSIITPDERKAAIVDKGCPTVAQRFAAMRTLTADMGLVVSLRLRPIVPGVVSPAECLELIERAHANGATGVSAEFFCMESRGLYLRQRYEAMSEAAGMSLYDYYKRQSPGQSGYLRLNPEVKRPYFVPMAALAKKLKMRFASSDMHFKYLNTCVGCCAVFADNETAAGPDGDGVKPFVNRGTLTWAIQRARDVGEVRRCEVDAWLGWAAPLMDGSFSGFMSDNTKRGLNHNQSLADALRTQWNNPNSHHSPYRYTYGLLEPTGVDENGDVIYRYRKDRE